jgi:hypothetical protein
MGDIGALGAFQVPGGQNRVSVGRGKDVGEQSMQALSRNLSPEGLQQGTRMAMEGVQASGGNTVHREQNRCSVDNRVIMGNEGLQASEVNYLPAVENQSSVQGMQPSAQNPPAGKEDQALAKMALEAMRALERPAALCGDDRASFERAVESAHALRSFSLTLESKRALERTAPPKEDNRASFERAVERIQASRTFLLTLEGKRGNAEKPA